MRASRLLAPMVLPTIVLLLVVLWVGSAHALPAPVPTDTTALSAADGALDGQTVRFTGEAIGDVLNAGSDHRWVNVLADGVAIGVLVPVEQVEVIDGLGEWSRTGTILEVVGVYNVADAEHGGDLDVHATSIRALRKSVPREHPIQPVQGIVAVVVLALSGVLAARFRVMRRRTYRGL